ncbi:MAG TPA: MMPL family transporter [Solirubrobacterales bacterium]
MTGSGSELRLRRPRLTLAAAAICIAVLGGVGLGVERDLRPTSLSIAGTDSARGEALAQRHFGDSVPFVVLLRGPAAAIERQGPRLAAALRRQPAAAVISPWDGGALGDLRIGPKRAFVLVNFHQSLDDAIRHTVPRLEAVVDAQVHPPLRAQQSGFATISRALQEESLSASERAELLAAPLLILILLLVFRSVVAAMLPLLLGVATVLASRGVLVVLATFMRIDALSLVVCTMMGLALGVDYSLLIVSRFREELARDSNPARAALRTRRSAGRTTIFAGATLFLSIFASAFVAPGALLVSLAASLVVVAAISIVIAWWVLPALLALLGERVNALPVGSAGSRRGPRAAALAEVALRRPVRAAALILVPLLLLALPALAFNTAAPGVDELSASSPARKDAETISRVAGPGWAAPFVLVAISPRGPITTRRHFVSLARWQGRVARQPGVDTVIGPAPIARASRSLRGLQRRLAPDSATGGAQLGGLGSRLVRASAGVARMRAGLAEASAGSGLLDTGSDRARAGAARLASTLRQSAARGRFAAESLRRLRRGAGRLDAGQREAQATGLTLGVGLDSVLADVGGGGLARARRLAADLDAAAQAEPALRAQAERADVLVRLLASAREELQRLDQTATVLNGGLARLSSGSGRLRTGVARLSLAAGRGETGLRRLGAGAERLSSGLGGLREGTASLQTGLADAFHRAYPLQVGLRRAGRRVSGSAHSLARDQDALRRNSPGVFKSGYFVLSALDGARPVNRSLAGEAIDLARGGRAMRMLVVPAAGLNSAGSREVQKLLVAEAESLAREADLQTGVAGGAAVLNDYGSATKARLPLVIGSVVLVTLLLLIVILRAPILAALVVCLNLISVGAALGIVSLLCWVPAGYPLGGHPYVDTVGAAAIFGVTFGLSIDYAVFLIARMRERHAQGADNATAISFGLERTAGLITGAAAIMAVVFVAFAAAPVATVSQMGVGLTAAILLDATVVRIVLLPALMLLVGERVWQVPNWLNRVLPQLNLEGEALKGNEATA